MCDDRVYNGKIGRLPFELRERLNQRLLDGAQGPDVLAWLNAHPAYLALGLSPVNAQNLSNWRRGGYVRWQTERSKQKRLAELAEQAGHIAAATGDPAGVGARLLLGRILEVIEHAGDEDIGPLVKAVAELRRGEAERARLDISREQLQLERARFQRQTCALFVEWCADRRAREIAADPATDTHAKTDLLGRLMFGELWAGGAT